MLRTVTVLVLLALLSLPAHAQKRVALVIGNSAYQYTSRLDNPKNDATDMAAVLKQLGFQVIEGFDLDKTAFERKVRDFSTALGAADVGLFFYAGHGLQVAGQNYLVPIDAKAETADALDWEMVPLNLVQKTMERTERTNIIFLDACRNNPLARNLARAMGTRSADIGRGLAQVESGTGTLISFSTQPGNVASDGAGRNSPFTGALVKRITTSNDDLSALLIDVRNDVIEATQNRQVPWENSSLRGRFYFNPAARPAPRQQVAVAEAPKAPPTQKTTAAATEPQLFFGRWTKFCLKGQEANATQTCFTGMDGWESAKPVVAAVLIEPEGEAKKVLRVTLPLGVSMVPGTRVIVDQGQPMSGGYVICFQNGCMADYEASADLIGRMKNGRTLTIQGINGSGQPLTFQLPLNDFAKANDGPPTDPKVFEAQQKKLQEELQRRAAAR